MLFDDKANDEAYNFWRRSVLKRVKNPEKQRILAPEKKPHPFGTKRNSFERRFYEVVDQDHVEIVDVNEDSIEEVTATGLRTGKGVVGVDVSRIPLHKISHWDSTHRMMVQILILASGFDSVTGSLAQLNIRGASGAAVMDHWSDGLRTSMGITLPDFPNMFFLYGPQAPTAFVNGPSCTQFQGEWLQELVKQCHEQVLRRSRLQRSRKMNGKF
jgi:cation diffusion facilitator CzcD-associated flavoprotein CzcO